MIFNLLAGFAAAQEPVAAHHVDVVTAVVEPDYPDDLQRLGIEGDCRMTVVLSAEAEFISAVPTTTDGCPEPLAEIMVASISQWSFQSFAVDGVAVPVTFQVTHRFESAYDESEWVQPIRHEWWDAGARPDDLPWPLPGKDAAPGPYTQRDFSPTGDSEIEVKRRKEPTFPIEARDTMQPGEVESCMVYMFFDETGRMYGGIVTKCSPDFAEAALETVPEWRVKPYPEDEPAPGVFVLKLTFKVR